MHVTFRQLRLFLALAETGSVSRAAAATHVTQPTASAQLKEITQSVGLPLYEVVGRRVFLTDTGRRLAQTARAISAEWEAFQQYADGVKGLARGRLRIAAVSTAKYFIPRLVGSFCKLHPAVDVSLEVLNRDGVVSRLKENLDDIYIMSMPPDSLDLEDNVFMDNPLVLIAARGTFPKQAGTLQLSQLKAQRFILREPGSGTRMAVDQHFRKHRFTPDIRMERGHKGGRRRWHGDRRRFNSCAPALQADEGSRSPAGGGLSHPVALACGASEVKEAAADRGSLQGKPSQGHPHFTARAVCPLILLPCA